MTVGIKLGADELFDYLWPKSRPVSDLSLIRVGGVVATFLKEANVIATDSTELANKFVASANERERLWIYESLK